MCGSAAIQSLNVADRNVTRKATLKSPVIVPREVKYLFSTLALQASHLVPKFNLVTTQPGLHHETSSQKQEKERRKHTFTQRTFIATLFIVAKHWGRSKCPQTSQWTNKSMNIYSVEHFSALRDDWPTVKLWDSINTLQPRNSKRFEKLVGAGDREDRLQQSTASC